MSGEKVGLKLRLISADADPEIISDDLAATLAETFKALADPTRIKLISLLEQRELCVGELAERLAMSLSAISHQLGLLRRMRLIKQRRDGRHIYYTLDDEHIVELYRRGLDHVQHA